MWTNDISSIVFARIKTVAGSKLKEKYPDIYFTTSDKTQTNPKFPTVYIHELPGAEKAQDLEGITINSALITFQIDVTDNQSQNRTKDVMNEIIKVMKSMAFTVSPMPEFNNTNSIYRNTARFRRTIDWNDIL